MRKGTRAESKSAAVSTGWRYEKELAKKTEKKQPVICQENQDSFCYLKTKEESISRKRNDPLFQILANKLD